jgi:outer membrane protein OmpA-like peptidoglycan-associated protein
MKTLLLATLFLAGMSCAAQATAHPQPHHYVVIGAFAIKQNAERFVLHAAQHNLNARFEVNPNRNLYYVYVLETYNRQEAVNEALRLRNISPYNDTWVFKGILGDLRADQTGADINPVTQQEAQKIVIADVQAPRGTVPHVQEQQPANNQEMNTMEVVAASASGNSYAQLAEATGAGQEAQKAESSLPYRQVIFSLYRADNHAPVNGEVLVIDMERSRKVGMYEANQPVRLAHPGNQSGEVLMQTEVFGYRKVQRTLQFNSLEAAQTDEAGNMIIPFELVRLQKGDIAVMYNVYFFKDAAVMRPESRWEVSSLLEMLNENPNYKIRIHGHTNGNAAGKIISRSDKSDNFFSLTHTRESFGSAKKLSQERAEAIRDFLAANGVSLSRMQIKAWGGKRPIVDKLHTLAENNVRVEIEILEH